MIIYEFINPDAVKNLNPGLKYTTRVVSSDWVGHDLIIKLEFLGEKYSSENPQCLFPVQANPERGD